MVVSGMSEINRAVIVIGFSTTSQSSERQKTAFNLDYYTSKGSEEKYSPLTIFHDVMHIPSLKV